MHDRQLRTNEVEQNEVIAKYLLKLDRFNFEPTIKILIPLFNRIDRQIYLSQNMSVSQLELLSQNQALYTRWSLPSNPIHHHTRFPIVHHGVLPLGLPAYFYLQSNELKVPLAAEESVKTLDASHRSQVRISIPLKVKKRQWRQQQLFGWNKAHYYKFTRSLWWIRESDWLYYS